MEGLWHHAIHAPDRRAPTIASLRSGGHTINTLEAAHKQNVFELWIINYEMLKAVSVSLLFTILVAGAPGMLACHYAL